MRCARVGVGDTTGERWLLFISLPGVDVCTVLLLTKPSASPFHQKPLESLQHTEALLLLLLFSRSQFLTPKKNRIKRHFPRMVAAS